MTKRGIPQMKYSKRVMCFLLFLSAALFGACSTPVAEEKMELIMELTENYDTADPFIDERLFYVSENMDTLKLDASFHMIGESGTLEVADNQTGQVLWSNVWKDTPDETVFEIPLNDLKKEKEYVIRFIGTKITDAKIVITSKNSLAKEREKSLQTNQASA